MLSYCLKCRKNTESKNPKLVGTKNGRIMILSKCSVCNCKNLKFLKKQEARGLLISLEIRIPLLGVKFLCYVLFCFKSIK